MTGGAVSHYKYSVSKYLAILSEHRFSSYPYL